MGGLRGGNYADGLGFVFTRGLFFSAVAFSRRNRPRASLSQTFLRRARKARLSLRSSQCRIRDVPVTLATKMLRCGLRRLISFRILQSDLPPYDLICPESGRGYSERQDWLERSNLVDARQPVRPPRMPKFVATKLARAGDIVKNVRFVPYSFEIGRASCRERV